MMRCLVPIATTLVVFLSTSAVAQTAAQGPTEALGECFVAKSTGEDRVKLARWIAVGMLASSKVRDVAQVAPNAREQADRDMASIFTRLVLEECLPQSQALFTDDPSGNGFAGAGEALGKIAMTELMSEPATEAAFGAYTKYLDEKRFEVLKKRP